jgi:integrase
MATNPAVLAGRNPQPPPRPVRAFTHDEFDAIAAELSPMYRLLPIFAAAAGSTPEEWAAVARGDIDRHARVLTVARTVSGGEIVELGRMSGSLRQVPLSARARCARRAAAPAGHPAAVPRQARRRVEPGQLEAPRMGPRRRSRRGQETSADLRPARQFISNALAAGVSIFEIARIAGTSVRMIEKHYGALLDGAGTGIAKRLDAFDDAQDREAATP